MSLSVAEAIQTARRTRGALVDTPSFARQQAANHVARRISEDAEALATFIVREGVKTIREARIEVERAAQTFRIAAEEAFRLTGETIAFDRSPSAAERWGHWVSRPIGIVAGITPYNDPLNLVAHKVAPAVACGTPIVIKPHEATPSLAYAIARYVAETDLPSGAVQVVEGGPETVRALVRDDHVRLVSFTGGTVAGRAVVAAAGPKKLVLELGGIGASYVHADADIQRAAERLASGIVWAAGQNCVHTARLRRCGNLAGPFVGLVRTARGDALWRSHASGYRCRPPV